MADRDPWIKFYPKDYLSDLELATCSAAAQGVYMRLLCLMHNSNEYGFAIVSGAVPTPYALAKAVQMRYPTCTNAVAELLQKCVLKKDHRGVLYSQRMLSDKEKLDVMRERGKLGGNPALVNPKDKAEQMEIQKENKKEKESVASDTSTRLTSLLRQLILENKPDRKLSATWEANTQKAIDDMLRIDKRDPVKVENAIRWCQADPFWWKNILSGKKLREKYDRLESDATVKDSPASRCCGTCTRGPAKGSEKYCATKFDGVMMGSRLFDDDPCEKWEA